MKKVVTHIIEAYIIHKQLGGIEDDEGEHQDKRILYKPLTYPVEDESRFLKTKAHLCHFSTFLNDDPNHSQLQGFLENIKIKEYDDERRPISWLELYVLYRLRGYKKPIDDPTNLALARATLDKQMNVFKKNVRAVSSRIYINDDQLKLFGPAKIKKEDLTGVGILGKHQGPSFNVFVTNEEQSVIAKQLHLLNHTISDKKLDKIIDGDLKFIPRNLIMRGRAEWDSNIKPLNDPIMINNNDWNNEIEIGISRNKSRNVVIMECSKRHKSDPDYVIKPSLFDVDRSIKCRHCNKASPSKNWNCSCGISWFLCDQHKWNTSIAVRIAKQNPEGEAKNKVAKTHSLGPTPRLPRVMVCHQELLKEDLNAESEKSKQTPIARSPEDITLDDSTSRMKRPRLLGPILAKRFGVPSTHLDTREESNKPKQAKRKQNQEDVIHDDNPSRCKLPCLHGVVQHKGSGVPSTHPSSSSSAP